MDAGGPEILRRTRCLPVFLLLAVLAAPTVAAELRAAEGGGGPGRELGRPLADVLREMGSGDLRLVFSSEVVGPEMRVVAEPTARDPRQRLEQLLAPHGLTVREAGDGVWVVVRRATAPLAGRVVDADGGGLAGAEVRLGGEGTTRELAPDAEGRFSVDGLEPGEYVLDATAPGYLGERLRGVRVPAVDDLVIRLRPQPYLSDEIVVRPSRLTLLHSRPAASFSLGPTDIERLPHLGGDLFRAVSLFPGTASNDVSARFSVRGGRPDTVKIVLDGQELYDAFHLKDFDSALSIVPAATLAAADLSTGSYPVDQGDRMGGVLDLRTADPPDRRRYLLDLGVLSVLLSSSGSFPADDGGWLVAARRGSLDLAGRAIDREDPDFWSALAKLEGDAAGGRVGLHLLAADDALELDKVDGEDREVLDNDYRSTHGWVDHRAALGSRLLVETVASWADVGRDRGGTTSEEEGSFVLRDHRDLEVLGVRQSWTWEPVPTAGRVVEWGAEVRRFDAFFDYLREQEPEVVILPPGAEPLPDDSRFRGTVDGRHDGLWASFRDTVLDRLTAEAGVRWDHHTATGDDLLSPRLNLAWRLTEGQVLRAAWGRFHQSQRPYELQVEDGEDTLAPAEASEHRVLGYEAYLGPNRAGVDAVRLELYQRRIDDPRQRFENLLEPINLSPEIEPDRVRVVPRESTMEGVEVSLRGRRGRRLGWWLSYAWARAEDELDGGGSAPRPLDQRHTVVVDLDLRLPRLWHLNLAWRYHDGWPTTAVAAAFVADPEEPEEEPELAAVFGPLYGERLPDYHRLDLRASRRWPLRSGSLTFYLDVQNLYDRQNLGGFDLAVDDEEGTVELEPESWPGLFPSLGIVWEF